MVELDQVFERSTLVRLCVVVCILNIVLVLVLAGAGILKTAERGDVTFLDAEQTPGGAIEAAERPFAVERPTDVDAFYDTVVRVRSGGPLYNPWGDASTVQRFHYSPIIYVLFVPFYFLGYLGFKVGWLLLSVFAVIVGTYLLVLAETTYRKLPLSQTHIVLLAVASVGFAPAVTNFKTGQTGVFLYLSIAVSWWYYRQNRDSLGGAALVLASLFKPYMASPLVIFANRNRFWGVIGFSGIFLLANIVGALMFGFDALLQYYEILLEFAIGDTTSSPGRGTSFDDWFASSLRPFAGVGSAAILLRVAVLLSFAYVAVRHLLDIEDRPPELFALSLVSVMLFIHGASVTDAAAMLAVFVVLGARLYRQRRAFALLVLSFLCFEAHPYTMEVLVGWGAMNIGFVTKNEAIVMSLVPFLQPGLYALVILLALVFYARTIPETSARADIYDAPEGQGTIAGNRQ